METTMANGEKKSRKPRAKKAPIDLDSLEKKSALHKQMMSAYREKIAESDSAKEDVRRLRKEAKRLLDCIVLLG